ncbi:MAG: methionyl-tRNA formyltransferase [Clostridia bacterium]|nr:methionyl-tRNA formyltransferase [Clostridia bacterium]
MRIVFLGTPDFAIPSLRAIAASGHEIVAVITQPDKPGNRRVMTPPPVKVEAERLGLPVYQFSSIRKEGVDTVRILAPDLMVTAAFGQIISQEILDIPKYGTLNVHGSLLPKYRGSSPIQQCLLEGDSVTGVTIMRTALAVDSGDIVLMKELPITADDTAGTLFDKISELGATAIVEAIEMLEKGTVAYTPQDHSQATFCKMISKSDALITKDTDATIALRKVRAYDPWPVAYVLLSGERLRLYKSAAAERRGAAGTFYTENGLLCLNLVDGAIAVAEVQAEGRKVMSARDYLVGHKEILEKTIE